MADNKKKYPFNWSSFTLRLEGRRIQGSKKPANLYFSASEDKVYLNLYPNHESMDERWSATLPLLGFYEFMEALEEMARSPVGTEKVVDCMAMFYFKDGKFNHAGTTVGLVKQEDGLIYLLVKNKKIPSIPFDFLPKGDYGWTMPDGGEVAVATRSRRKALAMVKCWRSLLDAHIKAEADKGSNNGGGSSGGSTGGWGGSGGGSSEPAAPADNYDQLGF